MSSGSVFDDAAALGKSWLATCLDNHTSCAKKARHANIFCTDNFHFITDLSGDGLVPSRLLTFPITAPSEDDEHIVRLVTSSELDKDTQYLALSHQWGHPGFPLPRTLESNVESHTHEGLPYKKLPRTFRDAIDVTRAMGYEYLWIDSLCIIQDSADDWKKEARRMAIIYDNAVLTIAAMDAENSAQGLFPANAGRAGSLETRAWVCQERMIAPRTLMFTKNSVAWECRQGSANSESPTLEQDNDEIVARCDTEDWVPPTRPKAIFAFFRDWRLPPGDASDTESGEVGEDVSEDEDSEGFDRHFDNIGDEEDKDPSDPDVDAEKVVVQDFPDILSLLCISADQLGVSQQQDPEASDPEVSSQNDPNTHAADLEVSSSSTARPNEIGVINSIRNFSLHGMDMTFVVRERKNANRSTEETIPTFTWSHHDPPVKIWNGRPPKGESGHFFNPKTGTQDIFYGNDLAAHAKNLRNQKDSPVLGKTWKNLSTHAISDDKDSFGRFKVKVTDLKRSSIAYEPFLQAWWNFLALYTPRNLTYDRDAFLAINGVTSVAQRWTHMRNSFGLWLSFIQIELCWYIDPEMPAVRPKTPAWLAPSWSWASTRGGLVRNAIWERSSIQPRLLIKPYIEIGIGTAFDMPLPFEAWRKSRHHSVGLRGNLRLGLLKRVKTETGNDDYEILLSWEGRCSDNEVYNFYPDCAEEIPLDKVLPVYALPLWHFNGNKSASSLGHHLDVMLMLQHIREDDWFTHYDEETMPRETAEHPRTMRRLGLVEAVYGLNERRELTEIDEDWWHRYVYVV